MKENVYNVPKTIDLDDKDNDFSEAKSPKVEHTIKQEQIYTFSNKEPKIFFEPKLNFSNVIQVFQILAILFLLMPRFNAIPADDCTNTTLGSSFSLKDLEECPESCASKFIKRYDQTYNIYQERYSMVRRGVIRWCEILSHSAFIKQPILKRIIDILPDQVTFRKNIIPILMV